MTTQITDPTGLAELEQQLQPLVLKIQQHPLYAQLVTLAHLQFFMEQYAFVVWGFSCLLAALHGRLLATRRAHWTPLVDPVSFRFIHALLQAEVCAELPDGTGYTSHYVDYLEMIAALGADTTRIQELIHALQTGGRFHHVLAALSVPMCTKDFVSAVFGVFDLSRSALGAAFFYGHERIIPVVFEALQNVIRQNLSPLEQQTLEPLACYLARQRALVNERVQQSTDMMRRFTDAVAIEVSQCAFIAERLIAAWLDFLGGLQFAMVTVESC